MKFNQSLKMPLAAAIAAIVAAIFVPVAGAATPAPGYTQFAGCPSPEENPEITSCQRAVVTGGHFQMGNKDVPITNPITLSGGTNEEVKNFSYNSKGGMTPVKQQVPGGVIGLTGLDWLVNFLSLEGLKLYAVTELAGQPQLGFTSLTLPIKVHLINPVLGSKCYVGSSSSPIVLNLTTGTTSPPPPNTPITGAGPVLSYNEALDILTLKSTYVDNSFAAPGANGCVLTLFGFIPISINGLVNSSSGLPSPAGTNETVQNVTTEIVAQEHVYP